MIESVVQFVNILRAKFMNLGAQTHELFVPGFDQFNQSFLTRSVFGRLLQKQSLLFDYFVVVGNGLGIAWVKRYRPAINEASPSLWATTYYFEFIGCEADGV